MQLTNKLSSLLMQTFTFQLSIPLKSIILVSYLMLGGILGLFAHTNDENPSVCYTITNPSANQTLCENQVGSAFSITTDATGNGAVRFVAFTTDQMAGSTPTTAESNFLYSYTGGYRDLAYITPNGSGVASYNFEPRDFPNLTNSNITYYVYAVLNVGVVTTATCYPAVEIQVTIKPRPRLNLVLDQYLCAGAATTATSFSSSLSGTTYSWTNNQTSIGLAASGAGNIAAFTATNSGASPVTAKVTVTPIYSGCSGVAQPFNIVAYPTSSTMISGVAFKDFNENGVRDNAEGVQEGIDVQVYNTSNTVVGTSTTDANGFWSVSGLSFSSGEVYRAEFSIPSALKNTGLQASAQGTGNRTDVQFISAPNCNINFGVNYPVDYRQIDAPLVTPMYVNGSRTANGGDNAVVIFKNTDRGQGVSFESVATIGEVGSVWGEAYNPKNKKLYVAAFVKRHADMGPSGIGAIYEIDLTNPTTAGAGTPTLWLNVNSASFVNQSNVPVNLNMPVAPSATSRGLDVKTMPNRDNWGYDNMGKNGMGAIELSADGKRMYVMDLTNRQVICIDYTTKKLIWKLAVSTPTCLGGSGDVRPWALKEHNGVLYVGAVCSGETNQNSAQLHYYIMQCNSLTAATSMSMAVDMGSSTSILDAFWLPWAPTGANAYLSSLTDGSYINYPQPLVSNIDFDKDENMLIGVMDRTGHQFGNANLIPYVTNTNLVKAIAHGSLTRAIKSGSTYTIEAAPWSFFNTRAGIPLSIAPYCHFEGGISVSSASGQNIAVINMNDPLDYESAGATWLKTSDGQQLGGTNFLGRLEIYPSVSAPANFGKANGIGDLESLVEPTDIQVGNYVWDDVNMNGVQDANESGFAGVQVELWRNIGASSTKVATAITNNNGEYYFLGSTSADTDLTDHLGYVTGGIVAGTGTVGGNSEYEIRLPNITGATPQTVLAKYVLTYAGGTANSSATNDLHDSDGVMIGTNASYTIPYADLAVLGSVNHSYDFGFKAMGAVGNFVWIDTDKNGLKDIAEVGINGVTVELWNSATNTLVSTTTTASINNVAGYYNFDIAASGSYYVKFPTSVNGRILTTQTITAATDDNSDANISTGNSPVFTINIDGTGISKYNPTIDAGYICTLVASIAKSNDLSCTNTSATLTASPSSGVSYLWDNGSTSATRIVTAAGTYTVTLIDNTNGCAASQNVVVNSFTTNPPCVPVTINKTK